MSIAEAQRTLQTAFERLEAAARGLKVRAHDATADDAPAALRAECDRLGAALEKALGDNAALAKATDAASDRIDAAVVRLKSALDA